MKLSALKIDSSKLEKGDWVSDIPELGEIELKVRGLFNADYRKRNAELTAALPRHLRDASPEKDLNDAKLLIETVLLDWRNLVDDDGRPVPFSADLAFSILSDPDFIRFRNGVVWAAMTVSDRRAADIADDAGN